MISFFSINLKAIVRIWMKKTNSFEQFEQIICFD